MPHQEQVHAVPEEREGGREEEERREDAGVVVPAEEGRLKYCSSGAWLIAPWGHSQVLNGVHAEASERLDVRVAVVQRVDLQA